MPSEDEDALEFRIEDAEEAEETALTIEEIPEINGIDQTMNWLTAA